jgi:hypothetical protein
LAKKKSYSEMDQGLNKNQIARTTTTAGDAEFASDLTAATPAAKEKKAIKSKKS